MGMRFGSVILMLIQKVVTNNHTLKPCKGSPQYVRPKLNIDRA